MEKPNADHAGTTPPDMTVKEAEAPRSPGLGRRHLLVFSGSSSWMYQLPPSGRVIIGRSEVADLRIDDASVSRQHTALTIDGDTVTVEDLGSQNGTYVNDVKLDGRGTLHANDTITIHKT